MPIFNRFAIAFSRFWDVIIMIFGNFGGPGAHFGGPGPHFEDFLDYCDFGSAFSTKVESILEVKMQTVTYFWVLRFLCVFGVLFFLVFCDFGCPEAPFSLPFSLLFGSPGPLKKQPKP